MHLDHRVPFRFHHVHQHAVAQNARVVHEDVERAERLDRLVDHPLGAEEVGDVVGVHHRFPATLLDGAHDFLRRGFVGADTVAGGAEVVDHDSGAVRREGEGVFTANAAASPGDDGDAAVQE